MKQHPVPQHIASYQFHLIGQMTLKQFLELAGGIIIGWTIYSLKISPFIKWPLSVFSCLFGAALAFLPLQERPLDRWIINFIKSIYSPTQYLWKKNPVGPDILKPQTASFKKTFLPKMMVKNKIELKEYLETLPSWPTEPIEERQLARLKQITNLLAADEPENLFQKEGEILPPIEKEREVQLRKLIPKKIVNIPVSQPVIVEKARPSLSKPSLKPSAGSPEKPTIEHAPPLTPPILIDSIFSHKLDPVKAAQFSTTLPIPTTPHVPNFVVGMILNDLGKIIPNALIEIMDSQSETVRALKTNKLGQFFCASPLKNGNYQLKVEHPNYKFAIIKFKAEGKIIPPLKIQAEKQIYD